MSLLYYFLGTKLTHLKTWDWQYKQLILSLLLENHFAACPLPLWLDWIRVRHLHRTKENIVKQRTEKYPLICIMCTESSGNNLELSFTKSNIFCRYYWPTKSIHATDWTKLKQTYPRKWISTYSNGGIHKE